MAYGIFSSVVTTSRTELIAIKLPPTSSWGLVTTTDRPPDRMKRWKTDVDDNIRSFAPSNTGWLANRVSILLLLAGWSIMWTRNIWFSLWVGEGWQSLLRKTSSSFMNCLALSFQLSSFVQTMDMSATTTRIHILIIERRSLQDRRTQQ